MAEENQRLSDIAEQTIRAEAGDKYDSRLHLANRMITENTQGWSEEKRAGLLEALNDNKLKPLAMDFLANIASNFMEHKAILTAEDTAPHDVQKEIDEAMNTDAYTNRNNPNHKMMVQKVKGLFERRAALARRTSASPGG
jgi:hypothetical protein